MFLSPRVHPVLLSSGATTHLPNHQGPVGSDRCKRNVLVLRRMVVLVVRQWVSETVEPLGPGHVTVVVGDPGRTEPDPVTVVEPGGETLQSVIPRPSTPVSSQLHPPTTSSETVEQYFSGN